MKRTEFVELLNEISHTLRKLTDSKGEEYKGPEDEQLGNFIRLAKKTGLRQEQVWSVLFTKHMDAIDTFIHDLGAGKTRERSEPIEGRIDDAILYLILLKAIVRDSSKVGIGHWLEEKMPRDIWADQCVTGRGEATPIRIYLAHDNSDPKRLESVKTHYQSAHHNNAGFTILSSPDSLHGIEPKTQINWAGPYNSIMVDEFRSACEKKGLGFSLAPLPQDMLERH